MEQKYRMLEVGEVIQATDEVWVFSEGPWEPVSEYSHGQQYGNEHNEMRRPIPAEESTYRPLEIGETIEKGDEWRLGNASWKEVKDFVGGVYKNPVFEFRRLVENTATKLENAAAYIEGLEKDVASAQSENERLRKDLCNTTVMLMEANSKNYDARQIIPNLEMKVTALQKDLEKSRRDLISETEVGLRSRLKLIEERDEAVAEVERFRKYWSDKIKEQWEEARETLKELRKI